MRRFFLPIALFLALLLFSFAIIIAPTFMGESLSKITANKELDLPLLSNSEKKLSLAFFGYAGCTKICTPRLQDIAHFYNSLDEKTKEQLEVVFLDISIPENKNLPDEFAKAFHQNFRGIYLDKTNITKYTSAFDVYFSPSLLDKEEFNHSSRLYLISREQEQQTLRNIYTTYPFNFKQIDSDIKEYLK